MKKTNTNKNRFLDSYFDGIGYENGEKGNQSRKGFFLFVGICENVDLEVFFDL